jgi:hypothetical protein
VYTSKYDVEDFGKYDGYNSSFMFDNGMMGNSSSNTVCWMWKSAPSHFDCQLYYGNGTAGRQIAHNLKAVPEMVWVKERYHYYNWQVYHVGKGNASAGVLNNSNAFGGSSSWNSTTPTDTHVTIGSAVTVNNTNRPLLMYMWATLAGITKVGSYTGTGSSMNIDCGFSSSVKFLMVKDADSSNASWYVFDTDRGISTSTDPYMWLDRQGEYERTSDNMINPYSSGFTTVSSALHTSGKTYIYYAVAP